MRNFARRICCVWVIANSGLAFATGSQDDGTDVAVDVRTTNTNSASVYGNSDSTATSNLSVEDSSVVAQKNHNEATGGAGGSGGAGGKANAIGEGGRSSSTVSTGDTKATGGEGGRGGSSSTGPITIEASKPRGTVTIKNTPAAISPDVYPTVSCFRGGSFSLGLPGFGASGGMGKIDPSCVEREEIRLAAGMGMEYRALFRWCNLENNVRLFGSVDACMAFEPEVEEKIPAQIVAPPKVVEIVKAPPPTIVDPAVSARVAELVSEIRTMRIKQEEREAADQRQEREIEEFYDKWDEEPPRSGK